MGECPKCRQVISTLEYTVDRTERGIYYGDGNFEGDIDTDENYLWYCIKCHEELFYEYWKAREFLNHKLICDEVVEK